MAITDDALSEIRQRDEMTYLAYPESGVSDHDFCERDRRLLLREVDRLRGRRSGEAWLAKIWQKMTKARADGRIAYPAPLLIDEIDRLISHIDWLEGQIHDILEDAGGGLAYQQGAAEERARIRALIIHMKGIWDGLDTTLSTGCDYLLTGTMSAEDPPELLPPAETRLALVTERGKADILREACERILAEQPGRVLCYEIAHRALGKL